MPSFTAVTVRARQDGPQVTDGPFLETKEALGGYYLIDCRDDQEALYWAKRLATGTCGSSVEFRALRAIPSRADCEQSVFAVNA
jgi:hypothetical protein